MTKKSFLYYLIRVTLLFAAYFGSAKFGLSINAVSGFATLVWPPTGIALSALLLWGMEYWPGILLAAALVNFSVGAPIFVALGMGLGNTLEAVLGAYLLRCAQFQTSLSTLADVLKLVILAGLVSTLLSGFIGVTSLLLGGIIVGSAYRGTWTAWWLGDVMGDLVVAPLLLVWGTHFPKRLNFASILEAVFVLVLTVFVCAGIFLDGPYFKPFELDLPYLVFPILLWGSIRFRLHGAVTLIFLVSVLSIWGTAQGYGPFVEGSISSNLFLLQAFLGIFALTGLVLAAVVNELTTEKERLEKATALTTSILQTSLDCIISMDHRGKIIEFNAAAEKTFGYRREEVLGRELCTVLIPPSLREAHRAGVKRCLETGECPILAKRVEYWAIRKDQTEFPAEMSINRLDVLGPPVFTGFLRDITEQKQSEEAIRRYRYQLEQKIEERTDQLRESEERYRLMMASISDYAIFSIDLKGRVNSWNIGAERLLGYSKAEILGKHFSLFFPEEGIVSGKPDSELKTSLSEGRFEEVDWRIRKDGSRFWANVVISPIRDTIQNVVGYVEVTRDMTERQRARELEEAIHLRDEFLSVASHELKTPVTALHLQHQVLRRLTERAKVLPPHEVGLKASELCEQISKGVEKAVQASLKLATLIDDLLDISRIRAGRLRIMREDTDLVSLVRSVLESLSGELERSKIAIQFSYNAESIVGSWDPVRIEQVITNRSPK